MHPSNKFVLKKTYRNKKLTNCLWDIHNIGILLIYHMKGIFVVFPRNFPRIFADEEVVKWYLDMTIFLNDRQLSVFYDLLDVLDDSVAAKVVVLIMIIVGMLKPYISWFSVIQVWINFVSVWLYEWW